MKGEEIQKSIYIFVSQKLILITTIISFVVITSLSNFKVDFVPSLMGFVTIASRQCGIMALVFSS